jgi:hypothetical protein
MRFNVGGATYFRDELFLVFASTANVLLLLQHQIAEQSCGYGVIEGSQAVMIHGMIGINAYAILQSI